MLDKGALREEGFPRSLEEQERLEDVYAVLSRVSNGQGLDLSAFEQKTRSPRRSRVPP